MIYAMEYTHKMGKGMKDFEGWLAEFEYFDLTSVVADVTNEAMNAFQASRHLKEETDDSNKNTDKYEVSIL